MKKKVCFIAQFPPPIHGLSKAVETLYNSDLQEMFDFERVDITNNKRFISNLIKIGRIKADLFYFTISQTKGGNIRDLIIFKLLEMQKKRCLIHLHGGYYRHLVDNDLCTWQRKANYRAIRKLAGAIVLGPSLKHIFQGMIDPEKILTVPNCVDDAYLMSDKEFEEKLCLLKERRIKHVLYLSNFIKSKGFPEVLEMARIEKNRVESGKDKIYHFDFAGSFFGKEEEEYFWQYIKDNKLDAFITYHGVVTGDEKRKLLKSSDIFVLLTRYPKEGQPISILEAMGNGMVIVTTNHAGIPDIVTDGENGLVFELSSAIDMTEVMKRLRRIDYVAYMKAGRNAIKTKFRESNYISVFSSVFSKL